MPNIFGMGRFGSGSFGAPGGWAEKLLNILPGWLVGEHTQDIANAIGASLDEFQQHNISDEFFIQTTTPAGLMPNWEKDFGIPVVATDSLADRRWRLIERRRGVGRRNDADYLTLYNSKVLPVDKVVTHPVVLNGQYVLYHPDTSGKVDNIVDIDNMLEDTGPAAMFLGTQPWTPDTGFNSLYAELIRPVAANLLTPTAIQGPIV